MKSANKGAQKVAQAGQARLAAHGEPCGRGRVIGNGTTARGLAVIGVKERITFAQSRPVARSAFEKIDSTPGPVGRAHQRSTTPELRPFAPDIRLDQGR